MIFKLDNMSSNQRYHLITQTVLPRPIAWILTANEGGDYNLAPFSYFCALSSDPALLVVSIGNKAEGIEKDSKKNLLREKECVIHIPSSEMAEAVNNTAATLDYGHSEVSHQGLSLTPFVDTLPRLEKAKVAIHCRLYDVHQLGEKQAACYLEIQSIHVDDEIVTEDSGRVYVDSLALSPLSRLGGKQYGLINQIISLTRPD